MIRACGRWGLMTAILLAGASAVARGEGGSAAEAPSREVRNPLRVPKLMSAPDEGVETANARGANARSDARAQARAQVRKGQLDYKLARFEDALQDYSRAYELYPAPGLLFNLGQCNRNLKNYERAIFFFEGYLREQPKIDPDQRALTEDLIAEARTALDRQNAEARAAAARFAPPPMASLPARQPATIPARLALRSQPAANGGAPTLMAVDDGRPSHDTPVTHRWWFWTAVVGTALAAGAAAYYATGDPRLVAPSGSVGTLDRR
jgi:tetratricopeptide (TPR) repeat protein